MIRLVSADAKADLGFAVRIRQSIFSLDIARI